MRASRIVTCAAILCATAALPARARRDPDVDRALAAARARAAAGDVIAQFSIGALLYYGSDDTAQALEWLQKAALQGYAPAEFQVGQMYEFGFVVARAPAQALEWYRRAADHGSAPAQRAVGDFYNKGQGVPVDATEAARWYRRAADADDLRAQYELGQLYFNGTGVARNYGQAYLWFSIAASQTPLLDNRKGLVELRNIAAARMSPEQVAEAERQVAAWKPAVLPAR